VHSRSAYGFAAIVATHLERIGSIDDAVVGPIQLGLLRLVRRKILERPKIRTRIHCDDGEAMLGKAASQRTAAGASAHNDEVNRLVFPILTHRDPSAGTEHIGRAGTSGARSGKGII
jgi:hypothetical protein